MQFCLVLRLTPLSGQASLSLSFFNLVWAWPSPPALFDWAWPSPSLLLLHSAWALPFSFWPSLAFLPPRRDLETPTLPSFTLESGVFHRARPFSFLSFAPGLPSSPFWPGLAFPFLSFFGSGHSLSKAGPGNSSFCLPLLLGRAWLPFPLRLGLTSPSSPFLARGLAFPILSFGGLLLLSFWPGPGLPLPLWGADCPTCVKD